MYIYVVLNPTIRETEHLSLMTGGPVSEFAVAKPDRTSNHLKPGAESNISNIIIN